MDQSGIRTKRLGGTIRKHLSELLAREVLDPRLAALAIERVEMTGDLSIANVTVRVMYGSDSPEARAAVLKAARAIAPGLRAALAPVLKMKRVPELKFHYDTGVEHKKRIDEVLAEIERENAERENAERDNAERDNAERDNAERENAERDKDE